jgi:S1-C subfamily serine protease
MQKLSSVWSPDYTRSTGFRRLCGMRRRRLICGLLLFVAASIASANSLPDVIDSIRPSIVAVGTYTPSGSPRQIFRGTGFVVDNGHLVVTNYHVLPERLDENRREELAVYSGRGKRARRHAARVIAKDERHDLALLYISAPLPAMQLSGHDAVREGTEIAFTGFPLGMVLGLSPVTHRGIVSAISPMAPPQPGSRTLTADVIRAMRDPYDVYQLDATAYPGNSGSPVYDQRSGKVLAVINSVLIKSGKEAAIATPTGITYAIPVEFVRRLLEKAPQ